MYHDTSAGWSERMNGMHGFFFISRVPWIRENVVRVLVSSCATVRILGWCYFLF